ncbi:hypothetical protein GCM10011392_18160 [Wenxinia marina]|nr:hypothetical protein GCM10011392_18160 [Wenxinia marina]
MIEERPRPPGARPFPFPAGVRPGSEGSANRYSDDDDNGNMEPRIVLTRPSNGILDVWVGTHDGSYCNPELRLETF